jgi:hypothetical protein
MTCYMGNRLDKMNTIDKRNANDLDGAMVDLSITSVYSLRPMKSAILVFLGQIGGTKRL